MGFSDSNQARNAQVTLGERKPLEGIFSEKRELDIARRILDALPTGFDDREIREFALRIVVEKAYAAEIKGLNALKAYDYTKSMTDFVLANGMMSALEREGHVHWAARCLYGQIYFRVP